MVVEASRAAGNLRRLPRYKQRSGCSPVFRLPMVGAAEITCLSAANEFYSRILSPWAPACAPARGRAGGMQTE